MKKTPKVSIIMPAYNAESYIEEAIESILNQTYKDFELIVINDCSTDATRKIIVELQKKDHRIVLIDNPQNLGIAKTLNVGLKHAKGEYVARMDSDDVCYPDRIERQVKLFESKPNLVLVSGNMDICDQQLKFKARSNFPCSDREIRKVILQYDPMVSPAMMWKREPSLEVGGFNPDVLTEDYMFIMDMSTKGKLENIEDPLIKYRILNTSFTTSKMQEAHLSTILVALIGHFKYKYSFSLKTKLIIMMRLLVAYLVPAKLWRFISTVLRL